MNKLKKKLRSRAGASLILAMVFMLFASFVGGTVLASATANAQRVAQMAEQQDFLLERSAALLVSDQFQMDSDDTLMLSVYDTSRTIEEVTVANGGVIVPTGRTVDQRIISFQVTSSTTLTPMHQLLLEATVCRYLREYAPGKAYDQLIFNGFPGDPAPTSVEHFLFDYTEPSADSSDYTVRGTMQVSAVVSGSQGVTIPEYVANFSSGRGEDLFDFFVDFGPNSQVKMTLNGYFGVSNPITITSPPTRGELPGYATSTDIRTIDVVTQYTISWKAPLIEKGGAR